MMQAAAAAAGPPLVAATPYSSYIPYTPQQFPGQPAMMQPMAHYPSQVTGTGGRWEYRAEGHSGLSPGSRRTCAKHWDSLKCR